MASGRPLVEWLERMIDLLGEHGSPALKADVMRYRAMALQAADAWLAPSPDPSSRYRLAS